MPRVSHFVLVIFAGAFSVNAAAQQLPDMRSQKAARRSDTRLDDQLAQLVERAQTMPAAQAAQSVPMAVRDAVPVSIRFDDPADVIEASLSQLGIAATNKAPGVIEAYVPVSLLTQVAALNSVKKVNAIVPPLAKVTSEGVNSHIADTWQAGGQTGPGVKVGIIDVGFKGLLSLLGTELPASVTAHCYTDIGTFSTDPSVCDSQTVLVHGTAVAETIVDVAPGVQVYIANPLTHLDLRNTVQWMTSQGVQIINHSVAWTWDGPGDGTSPFTDAPVQSVDLAVTGGAMWVNAAGNEAQSTWTGALVDSDNDGWLEFQTGPQCAPTSVCTLNALSYSFQESLHVGQQFIAQARWEDSWTAAARDLDLYLFQWNASSGVLTIVAGSEQFQSGSNGEVPLEILAYTPPVSCACTYYLAVHHYSGSLPGSVQVQAFTSEALQYRTSGHSIANPAESANPAVLAVGAAPWYGTSAIEFFSSQGPTTDGRTKPDLVGADRGSTVSYGVYSPLTGGFGGTSQASPHVAGLAALVLGAFPNTPPTQLAAYLRATASPHSPANSWGAGFAQVPAFPSTISVSAFLSDKTFPVPATQPITWRAFAIGGNGPFEYQFWVYDGVNWTLGQGYCPSNTFTWTPPGAGTYLLQVWARHIGSSAAFEDWKSSGFFSVTGAPAVAVTSLTSNVAFPVSFGTPITWTATATGGTALLQYQFWRLRQGVGWTMVQDYSPNNTFMWTPGVTEGGTYSLQVWVRSAGSAAIFEAWRGVDNFVINGPAAVTVTSFTSNVSFPSPVFSPITWTATASGGVGPLLYQFWRLRQGVGWTMVQDYSTLNTFSWTPVDDDAGSYVLQVWVKSSLSSAAFDAWSSTGNFQISPPGPVQITSLASSVMLPAPVGTPITLSATATGGSPPVQFKFWLRDGSGVWSVLQDYSPVSNVTWTPTQAGNYIVQVWARSNGSAAAFEDWRGMATITISPVVPMVSSLTSIVGLPAIVTDSLRPRMQTSHKATFRMPPRWVFDLVVNEMQSVWPPDTVPSS
jgi:subtilisin family serine protease